MPVLLNGWIEAPTSYHELPWDIKAGKKVLWYIILEACEPYPERRFIYAGSLTEALDQAIILDKDEGSSGGFSYKEARAYQYCMKGPYDE